MIMKARIILLLIIVGMMSNMELLVRYQPTGEKWHEFQLEEGIKIDKERNSAATASVLLPNTFATENASGYGKLQVLLNNQYLFDGTSQSKGFSKDKIKLTAYDYLWNLTKLRRMMEQGSTSITPSQAFTDVFDNSATSSYFTGIWGESYSGPWKTGYDASTYVIPAESATTYGDPFFDAVNKSGTDFMKFLGDISYQGERYRYFYWFENINGSWYLFFQPDGWGKTWKNLIYEVTSDLKETFEDIWNDIVIWGTPNSGYFPTNGDLWTEDNIAGWNHEYGNFASISLSATQSTVGNYSLKLVPDGLNTICNLRRYFTKEDGSTINLENMIDLNYKVYPDGTGGDVSETFVLLSDSTLDYFISSTTNLTSTAWNTISFAKSDFSIGAGTPDWTDIEFMVIDIQEKNAATLDDNYYLDNFYINFAPIKSTIDGNGYDSTSAGLYERRTPPPINFPWFGKISQCDSMASSLLNYFKDPSYQIGQKYSQFIPFKLNDNVNFTRFGKDLTLPIHKLSWDFKSAEEVITTVELGLPRVDIVDRLKKISTDVLEPGKSYGLQFYVY